MTTETDRNKFPSLTEGMNKWRANNTYFWCTFSVMEEYGIIHTVAAFKRAFEQVKNNARQLVELCLVMNHKCWQHNELGHKELSQYYADRYYECYDRLLDDDAPFANEERSMAVSVLD